MDNKDFASADVMVLGVVAADFGADGATIGYAMSSIERVAILIGERVELVEQNESEECLKVSLGPVAVASSVDLRNSKRIPPVSCMSQMGRETSR